MPLPTFATRDEIPEPFRDEYEEKDGQWHPKVPDTSGLTSALATERERAASAEKARKAAEARARELEREREAKGAGITEDQLAALRKEDEDRRKADVEPLQAQVQTLSEKVRTYELVNPLHTLFVTQGGLFAADWDDLDVRAGILRRFSKTSDGDALVVLDEKGNATAEKPETFLAAYQAKYPHRFSADVGSGGGAERTTGRGGPTATAVEVARARQARKGTYAM